MKPNTPQLIDINLIDAHPMNPRPEITPEDVADLVGVMDDEYSPSHPIRVRQIGERYQILGGHRRVAASRIKGHSQVWGIVEVMGREKAFMELVRDNAQKELDPLYVGIHAYMACDLANDGDGIKGGISEYARLIGRDQGSVSRLRAAGRVAKVCRATYLVGMSRQLYEISRMPEPCWQDCVDWLVGLTAEQRANRIGTIRDVSCRVSMAMSLELPEDVRGTGKELTARMDVFVGRGVQRESPNAETLDEAPVAAPEEHAETVASAVETDSPPVAHENPVQSHEPQPVVESHATIARPAVESPAPVYEDIPFGAAQRAAVAGAAQRRRFVPQWRHAVNFLLGYENGPAAIRMAIEESAPVDRLDILRGLFSGMSDDECEQVADMIGDRLCQVAS